MNSVPQHLLSEDRQEYERILDEALRSAPHSQELAAAGRRLNVEQLRTMALNATHLITAAAATEYQHYVQVREELRRPAPAAPSSAPISGSGAMEPGTDPVEIVTSLGGAAETTGAGAVAVVAVLAPVLAGTAAALFLLVGYLVKMLHPAPALAQTMITTGWVFGALTAASILVAAVGLLLTALRNSPSLDKASHGEAAEEVDRAREAWREALLERGLLPFLQKALAEPGTAAALRRTSPQTPTGRIPRLGYGRPGFGSPDVGYDRPGFSSPDDGTTAGPRPSFTSPDYTSPDFGGPEHQPE